MDALALVQSIVPLILAIIFTAMAVSGTERIIVEEVNSVLTPIWCFLAFLTWVGYGIINIYGATLDYLAGYSWLYIGIGLIFFPVLFFVSLLMNLKVSGKLKAEEAEVHEMEMN
jgi:hypothetical protein